MEWWISQSSIQLFCIYTNRLYWIRTKHIFRSEGIHGTKCQDATLYQMWNLLQCNKVPLIHHHHHHHRCHHCHHHHHHHRHLANIEFGHLLACSVCLMVSLCFFCLLVCSFVVFLVIYYGTFSLYVATSFFCIPVFCPKLVFWLCSSFSISVFVL